MSNEVQELLAKVGEAYLKRTCSDSHWPYLSMTKTFDPITKQYIFSFPDEPRKLVLDPDGAINWYNSELPEVV